MLKLIATTPDPNILIVRIGRIETPMRKRDIPNGLINAVYSRERVEFQTGPKRKTTHWRYDWVWSIPETENPAWTHYKEDCIAVLPNGKEVVCESLKQIKAVCKTGEAVETARQKKTREWNEYWERTQPERDASLKEWENQRANAETVGNCV